MDINECWRISDVFFGGATLFLKATKDGKNLSGTSPLMNSGLQKPNTSKSVSAATMSFKCSHEGLKPVASPILRSVLKSSAVSLLFLPKGSVVDEVLLFLSDDRGDIGAVISRRLFADFESSVNASIFALFTKVVTNRRATKVLLSDGAE